MRNTLFLILLFIFAQPYMGEENSKYFVFVGEKISLEPVPPKAGETPFDSQFLAKYRVLEPFRGTYKGTEIEFTVFDHYGTPSFSRHKYVLLYVELHDGHYYHSKYQYSPLYKTKSGKWAAPYSTYDYQHEYNKHTTIKPEIIEFAEPVVVDIPSRLTAKEAKAWYPAPFYKIEGKKAIAVYGNYIDELFRLKQNGVLKARGDFQQKDLGTKKAPFR
jgi:hypothetical protein